MSDAATAHDERPTISTTVVKWAPEHGVELILQEIGPTTLIAIVPDGKGSRGCWLDTTTVAQGGAWAAELNKAGANVYFTLNEPRLGMNRKSARTDITALRGIGADVDAKDARTMDQALAAIDAVQLAPSLVIMSGHGWQPLWLFDKAIPATAEAVRHVETIGKHFAQLTGGDPVQNVDRIFRLPFTTNYPNAKKRAQNGVERLSGILIRRADG